MSDEKIISANSSDKKISCSFCGKSQEEVKKRLKSFEEDIKHWDDYDYIVTNDDLENCFKQIENIILLHKKPIIFPRTIQ